MNTDYQIVNRSDTRALAKFLSQEGQVLLPVLQLIERTEMAVDELIDLTGRATLEAILTLSAQQVAGPKHPGKAAGKIRWHGSQTGVVPLAERKVRVRRPRLRRKGSGRNAEVEIPAYEALQMNSAIGRRILEILMRGVSSRNYRHVLPEMAETVGVSKSSISREFTEASEQALKALMERRFDDKDILILYLDGLVFGEHHVVAAIGVDSEGRKHVLGLAEGASENATVVRGLLEDLVARGISPGRRRLFVIDGSKALRSAIDAVYGKQNPVQRCRNHKIRNVVRHLPDHLEEQVEAAMKAAYRLEAKKGMAQLEKQAQWLQKEHPSAAASLREGLAETFTVNRLGLPGSLRRCLCTTNVIESPHSGVRLRTRRVSRWKDGAMVLRWVASGFVATEKSFRRLMGYQQLWMLKAYLDDLEEQRAVARKRKVG